MCLQSLAAWALAVAASSAASAPVGPAPDFGAERPSSDARFAAASILVAGGQGGRPFAVVDKASARLYVFDARGRLLGAAPALLGQQVGDETVPGVGDKPPAEVLPHERTTPAGRFASEPGRNLSGEDIVWVDYDAAVSMHRVRPVVKAERRLERLATPTPADNRITYGCINVPAAFYDRYVKPALGSRQGVVYVLPDQATSRSVFGFMGH